MEKKNLSLMVLGAALLGAVFILGSGKKPQMEQIPSGGGKKALVYTSEKFGFMMYYPEGSIITEKDLPGSEMRLHHIITLLEDTPGNRDFLDGKITGGESPPAITVDIIQNNLDRNSAEEWIKNSSASNFKLSDGNIIPAVINGVNALSYHSAGLYDMDHAVFEHGDYIYMFSVSYLSLSDPIRRDFQGVVTSVQFKN